MAATGVTVNDAVITQFNEMKLGKSTTKYIIYQIEGGVIVTEKVGLEASFDKFTSELPPDDCRYAIYDMPFTTNDGRPAQKLVFIAWLVYMSRPTISFYKEI